MSLGRVRPSLRRSFYLNRSEETTCSETGSRHQLTLDVENVDAICAELTGRGVELLNGPMDRDWGIRTASFRDPGGYFWRIAQPL